MKKNLRMLLIMLAVLVVVGGGAAALLLTMPAQEEETSSSSSTATETILETDAEEFSSVSVENTEDSFVIVPVEEGTTTSEESSSSESSSSSTTFTVEGLESFDIATSSITSGVQTLEDLQATKNLGEQENLEQFGLSGENASTITIHYKDGATQEIVVGNEAGETTGRYVLIDGVVYISSSVSNYLLGSSLSFINTSTLYSVAGRTEETTDSEGSSSTATLTDILYSVELGGTHLDAPITIVYDSSKISSYLITSPVYAESGSNTFTEMATALKTLSANSVAAVGRTQEVLEEYGLSEPEATIAFNMNGEEHSMAVSAKNEDGNRYLILDDIQLVYEVAADSVSTWADSDLMDMRMSFVWLPTITNVSRLTLTVDGDMVYAYDATRTVNEEKSTEDNTSYDLSIQNAAGEEITYENYQSFYQQLLSVAVLSTKEATYDAESPVLRVEYQYFDGSKPDVIEFCPVEGEDARYAAVLNGGYNGLVRKTEVEALIEKLAPLDANEALAEERAPS